MNENVSLFIHAIKRKKDVIQMLTHYIPHPDDFRHYTTDRLRDTFLISDLFLPGELRLHYVHSDRMIVGGAVPTDGAVLLDDAGVLHAQYFLQNRELGCINIGGPGCITVDGTEYEMASGDGLYVGRGCREVQFSSRSSAEPAKFYFASTPAHAPLPNVKVDVAKARSVPCGSVEECNRRTIRQYLHPEVLESCQLTMGMTTLEPGSNWNTMPAHTHDRRSEVYLYFGMTPDDAVFHIMGQPEETRHLILRNEEAVISPAWSIHSGVGTKSYTFIWAMGGENRDFGDMDGVDIKTMR